MTGGIRRVWLLSWLLLGSEAAGETPVQQRSDPRREEHWEAVACFGTAVWQGRHGRLMTAARFLEESLRREPQAAAVRRELARIYEELEQLPAAIRQLQTVRKTRRDDRLAAEHLCRLLRELGLTDEVADLAREALKGEVPPPDWAAAIRLARYWAETAPTAAEKEPAWRRVLHWTVEKRNEGVQAAVWTPRRADLEAAQAWEALSRVLLEQDRLAEAEQARLAAERLYRRGEEEQGWLRLYALRAELAARQKQWAVAVQEQRRYLEAAQPDEVQPYRRYVQWMQQAGRSAAEVTAELQRLYEQSRESPAVGGVLAVEWGRHSATRQRAEQLAERLLQRGVDKIVLQELLRGWVEQGRGLDVLRWLERTVAPGRNAPEPPSGTAPQRAHLTLERAHLFLRALLAEPNLAEQWLRQVQGAVPSAEAAFFLGHLAEQLGQWALADHFYRQSAERIPAAQRDAVLLRRVEVLRRLQRWEEVAEVCQRRVQDGPAAGRHVFLWHQALALAHRGQHQTAEALAQKAREATPAAEQVAASLQQARLWAAMGQAEAALELLDCLLKESLTGAERQAVHAARAQLLQQQGKRSAARLAWQAVLRQDPDHAAACRELALLLAEEEEGDLAQAEQLARHARYAAAWQRRLLQQPQPLDALTTAVLGRVLFRQKRLDAARQLLETAAALPEAKRDRRIWLWLADVYESVGESAKAAAARQRSQTLPPPP
ncbi:MAG: tetratricopeptide repeat protein [Gemmataceae bacterium]|nr:tetratricopeptide repeat protein [Gemmataceae bacterium]